MEKNLKLYDAEYRFACIVWDHEPVQSGDLARITEQLLGWKRTTTYTVLKKLCTRKILQNEGSIVTSLVKQREVQQYESREVMQKNFGGSLPQFITAFLGNNSLSEKEAEEIKGLIDRYKEKT
ncbi:Predicted transcriptional regulator [Anaerocolumna jejuensis DSM 15929]|uniref:Predicted transcriptional regulator n=1 Tax=Anaerocolumna jejuensis DSM 15929 TaxID=1121322 RepID=A0A1M6SQR4_9FIRM|nr:BlaI/MecI/CopY family transcriptional regulator [Anaerocolumna jejuensis]SHK47025.1 Predicted transcriptional regulator [Anaerocolumna jejuensis DSM 15929]